MLDTLYNQVSATDKTLLSLPTAGFMDGTVTAQVIEYVMGAMFLVLPMFFLGAMSWAGYNVGSGVQTLLTRGTEAAQVQAEKGSSQLISGAQRLK
ncbi:hypothetical protein D3C75_854930 [compost metagenome]